MLHFSKSVSMKKLIHISDGLRVSKFSSNLNLWVNCSFNVKKAGLQKWKNIARQEKTLMFNLFKHWMFRQLESYVLLNTYATRIPEMLGHFLI